MKVVRLIYSARPDIEPREMERMRRCMSALAEHLPAIHIEYQNGEAPDGRPAIWIGIMADAAKVQALKPKVDAFLAGWDACDRIAREMANNE